MTELKKVRYRTKVRTARVVVLLSRFLVALLAATVLLVLPVQVLAQQSAHINRQTQVVSEAIADNTIHPFQNRCVHNLNSRSSNHFSWRDLPTAKELGRASLPQPDLLSSSG